MPRLSRPFLLLALALGPVTGTYAQAPPQATSAVQNGRFDEAIRLLTPVIAANPRNADALVLRGRAYEGKGDWNSAANDYRRALTIQPGNTAARQGNERLRARQAGAATGATGTTNAPSSSDADVYGQALRRNPNDLNARLRYADALYRSRRWSEAAEQYELYLQRTPANPAVVQRYLIALAGVSGGAARGEAVTQRYLQRFRTSADLWMRLGYFRLWQGKNASAQEAFAQALRLQPGNRDAQRGLAQAQNPQSGGPSAYPIDVLTRELRQNPNQDDKRWQLIDLLIQNGRYFEAKQNLDVLASRFRDDSRWQQAYATVNARLPRQRQGPSGPSAYPIDVLTRELRQNPNQDDKRWQLIDLLIQNRRYFEAKQNLDAFASRFRSTPRWQRAYATAQAGLPQGRPGRGGAGFPIDVLYASLRSNPNQPEKRFDLVDELVRYRRYGEAWDQLQILADGPGVNDRWLRAFLSVDRGLTQAGLTPLNAIDRLFFRLRANPADAQTRAQLADALIAVGRVEEAAQLLTDGRYAATNTEANRARFERIEQVRRQLRAERRRALETRLASNPTDIGALRDLAQILLAENRVDEAITRYEQLVAVAPTDSALAGLGRTYYIAGNYAGAREQAVRLIGQTRSQAMQDEAKLLYAQSAIASREVDDAAETYLNDLLRRNPNDPDILIEFAYLRLVQERLDEAETYNRRAAQYGEIDVAPRVEVLSRLIERERVRLRDAGEIAVLNEGRVLSREGRFEDAITKFEEYWALRGRRTRDEVKEYAALYSAAGDFVNAISIWHDLLAERYEYDVEKEIAKNLFYLGDYTGTIVTAERLVRDNPSDFEVRILQGDAYRDAGRYADAADAYAEARRLGQNSLLIEERETILAARMGPTFTYVDASNSDFGAVFAPIFEAVVAKGNGGDLAGRATHYERYAPGLLAQVTVPGPVVITAGVMSHYMQGNRILQQFSDTVRTRANQVFGGAYYDLNRVQVAPYTYDFLDRIEFRGGIYDYEGDRTAPFFEARYWKQDPGKYRFSLGGQTTEGSVALWSAAGDRYDLRLNQLDIRGEIAPFDSLMRFKGIGAYNYVTDRFDTNRANYFNNLPTRTSYRISNHGMSLQAEGSFRMLRNTYLGVAFYGLDYRRQTPLYFSPDYYLTYDGFIEYEKGMPTRDFYLRLRASLGFLGGPSGALAREQNGSSVFAKRVDGDLIWRFHRKASIVLNSGLGQSTRPFNYQASVGAIEEKRTELYTIFTFQGALYVSF